MSWIHHSNFAETEPRGRRGRPPNDAVQQRNLAILENASSMSLAELALKFNVGIQTVRIALRNGGLKAQHNVEQTARNAEWCDLYRNGQNATQIAAQFGVTRERVCQILRKENLIEHRTQRRQLARELVEQDLAAVQAEKAEQDQKIIDAVRGGKSCADAAAMYGMSTVQAIYICKKHGVESQHGRWRDFSARYLRIKELLDAGQTLSGALRVRGAEEGRIIGYLWVQHNHPELCDRRRNKAMPRAPEPTPPLALRPRKAPLPVYDIEANWSPEKTAELIRLWLGGTSAQQIIDIFGAPFTRNSVLGKVYRLRLAGQLKLPE